MPEKSPRPLSERGEANIASEKEGKRMANYDLRVLIKKKDLGWWLTFGLFWVFFVFFPWKVLGIKPLWFGWVPNWLGVAAVIIAVYVALWINFFQKKR